jgi:hypothetical protein
MIAGASLHRALIAAVVNRSRRRAGAWAQPRARPCGRYEESPAGRPGGLDMILRRSVSDPHRTCSSCSRRGRRGTRPNRGVGDLPEGRQRGLLPPTMRECSPMCRNEALRCRAGQSRPRTRRTRPRRHDRWIIDQQQGGHRMRSHTGCSVAGLRPLHGLGRSRYPLP